MGRTGRAQKHTCDSEEFMQICLSCTRPTCSGSCSRVGNTPAKKPRGSKLDQDNIGRMLATMGWTDAEIAKYVGMHKTSVAAWRRQNGIPRGRGVKSIKGVDA